MSKEEPTTAKQIQQKEQAQRVPKASSSKINPVKQDLKNVPIDKGSEGSEHDNRKKQRQEPPELNSLMSVDESNEVESIHDQETNSDPKGGAPVVKTDEEKAKKNLSSTTETAGEDINEQREQPEEDAAVAKTLEGSEPQCDSKVKDESASEPQVEDLCPPKKKKPQWQDKEPPEELGDRVPHVMQNSEDNRKWGIVAASVRGKSHAHKGSFREDSFKFDQEGQWTIIAVGDGAGSAKLSRVGSVAVCESAVGKLKELLKDYSLKECEKDAKQPAENELQQLKAFLVLAACEARNELLRKCHEKECQFDDLSTTLLVVLHCEWNSQHVLCSLQVGDGAIGIYEDEKHSCTLFGDADHGAHASETIFMTSRGKLVEKPFDQRIQFSIKPAIKCVGVMSDGVSDDFFPEKDRLVELFNGQPINGIVGEEEEPLQGVCHNVLKDSDPERSLVDWLGYEQRGSFDDRTLVLFYRK
jgi:hypothetical protein